MHIEEMGFIAVTYLIGMILYLAINVLAIMDILKLFENFNLNPSNLSHSWILYINVVVNVQCFS